MIGFSSRRFTALLASSLAVACSSTGAGVAVGVVGDQDAKAATGDIVASTDVSDGQSTVDASGLDAAADAAPGGKIAIYLKGVQDKPAPADGLAGQTPTDFQIAISRYEVLRTMDDNMPQLCFDLGSTPAVADMKGDNLVGTCQTFYIATALYNYGRTTVAWSRFTVQGTLHYGGQPFAGKFTFFRAWSDTTYSGKSYKAGMGTLRFQDKGGIVDNTVDYAYPPLESPPGMKMQTQAGEFTITFPYSKPLPIVQAASGEYWARFNWHVLNGFRWQDAAKPGFETGVWDVVMPPDVSEDVKSLGATGYHVTSSLD